MWLWCRRRSRLELLDGGHVEVEVGRIVLLLLLILLLADRQLGYAFDDARDRPGADVVAGVPEEDTAAAPPGLQEVAALVTTASTTLLLLPFLFFSFPAPGPAVRVVAGPVVREYFGGFEGVC